MLCYLSFITTSNSLDLERSSKTVVFMHLHRRRVTSACFRMDIAPDVLRAVVSEMRRLGKGLERWIVPALEYTSLFRPFREDNPEAYALVPELLESCRDLPVADHWKRVRADVIARAEKAEARAEREAAKKDKETRRVGPRRRRSR
ncbi:MAG TPA: hypothetical protein VK447_15930 [Myxococcaceae bacterium]|nr:hypothetical protein [Myxococcaceae bacterium]